jgi:hypothetical protein
MRRSSGKSQLPALKTEELHANELIRTPYLWPKTDGPRYVIALSSSAAFSIATFALAWVAKIVFMRKNKKLREASDEVQTFYVY